MEGNNDGLLADEPAVVFLNPRTCGIYKNGGPRYKSDAETGRRTGEIDNELLEYVDAFVAGAETPGEARVPFGAAFDERVLVPTYYDYRHSAPIDELLVKEGLRGVALGDLIDQGVLVVRGGHGSPGNDQRNGTIPYIKVSDIRGLRINVNPTNLVSAGVAERFWRGRDSGLKEFDLITPNRASSNIGEFAILLPGEEQIVVTKEVFIFRVADDALYDPFYLLWALSLKAVREEWRRVTLMQTNREDCGDRYREIVIPKPPSKEWAMKASSTFRRYFTAIAEAKADFVQALREDGHQYVASASSLALETPQAEEGAPTDADPVGD